MMRMNLSQGFIFFFKKDSRLGLLRLWLLIPFLAKNSRLGYFFYAKNLRRFSQSKFHFDFEDDSATSAMRFGVFRFSLLINASSFFSKKIRDGDCFASLMIPFFAKNSRLGYFFNAKNLRRFSQSKFHFDFEDDSATGTASPSLLVPLFAKNSRLGYFFNAK